MEKVIVPAWFKPGFKFKALPIPGNQYVQVEKINIDKNTLDVFIHNETTQFTEKDWNLEHTLYGIEQGEYTPLTESFSENKNEFNADNASGFKSETNPHGFNEEDFVLFEGKLVQIVSFTTPILVNIKGMLGKGARVEKYYKNGLNRFFGWSSERVVETEYEVTIPVSIWNLRPAPDEMF